MSARVEKCEENVFHTTGQMNQENQKGFGPLKERGGVGVWVVVVVMVVGCGI